MSDYTKGGDKLDAFLVRTARAVTGATELRVGFLEGATYPDTGVSVALIAAVNEFGRPGRQPPRPFFRGMIDRESPQWGYHLGKALEHYDWDSSKALTAMGEMIKGQLQDSILRLMTPKLAESTVRRKGFDKPLIESSHMLNSVGADVK